MSLLPSFQLDLAAALKSAKSSLLNLQEPDPSPEGREQGEERRRRKHHHRARKARSRSASPRRQPRNRQDEQRLQEEEERQRRRVARVHMTPRTYAVLVGMGAYVALRGGIQAFHHMRRHFLRQLLLDLCAALRAMRRTYWVDFGSLLGIHRDGDLIPHDNDIDLAVYRPDWEELRAALQTALPQYAVRVVVPSESPDSRFIRVYCPLGMADVFGAEERGNGRILVDCGHGDCCSVPADVVMPTASVEWRGCEIAVPGNVPGMLECRYGPTWTVPRYMDKGADIVEANKLYARIFRALGKFGICL